MRKLFVFFLLGLLFLPGYGFSSNDFCENLIKSSEKSRKINFNEAIAIALKENPQIKKALHDTDKSKAAYKKALSNFMPSLSTYADYSTGDAPSSYLFKKIDQRKLPPDTNFNDPGSFDNYEAGLSVSMRLFNGGKNLKLKDMSLKQIDLSYFWVNEIKNNIAFAIINAWYDILISRDFVKIASESVDTIDKQLKIIEIKYKGGSALKSDVLSLNARLLSSKATFLNAFNDCRLMRARLAVLIGFDPETGIDISGGISDFASLPENYQALTAKAVESRPVIGVYKKQSDIARINYEKEKRGYLPTLDFKADYYHDDPHMEFSKDRENYRAGLLMEWKLFDGFSREAQIKEAAAALYAAKEEEKKAVLDLKFEIRRAWFNIDLAQKRLEVAKMQKQEAEASFDLVKNQYSGGSADITRYLEAELARNSARILERKAFYDLKKSRADAARAVGMLYLLFENEV